MDVLGATASISQLGVYTHAAWKLFTRLYIELKGGPATWQTHITNLEHLIHITKRISSLAVKTQVHSVGQISSLVRELQDIGERALEAIAKTRVKVFGIHWSAIGVTEALEQAFESLKPKRELLLMVLAFENLHGMSSLNKQTCQGQQHPRADGRDQTVASRSGNDQPQRYVTIEMVSRQVGNGSSMISNNGLGLILDRIEGPVRLSTSSDGDGVVVNSNNVEMDPNVVKKQLEYADSYARAQSGRRRSSGPTIQAREGDAEPERQRLALQAS